MHAELLSNSNFAALAAAGCVVGLFMGSVHLPGFYFKPPCYILNAIRYQYNKICFVQDAFPKLSDNNFFYCGLEL